VNVQPVRTLAAPAWDSTAQMLARIGIIPGASPAKPLTMPAGIETAPSSSDTIT